MYATTEVATVMQIITVVFPWFISIIYSQEGCKGRYLISSKYTKGLKIRFEDPLSQRNPRTRVR